MNTWTTGLLAALVLSATPVAWAVPITNSIPADLAHRVRMIDGQKVDLTPLWDWYKAKQAGKRGSDSDRPLLAWKRVRLERVVQQTLLHWTVEADVEGTHETIILQNPPKREWDEFNRLKLLHAQLLASTNRLQQELRRVTAARRQADYQECAVSSGMHKWGAAAAATSQADAVAQQEILVAQNLDAARAQLKSVETAGYDFSKPFSPEIFALKTSRKLSGKPVYDRGRVF